MERKKNVCRKVKLVVSKKKHSNGYGKNKRPQDATKKIYIINPWPVSHRALLSQFFLLAKFSLEKGQTKAKIEEF